MLLRRQVLVGGGAGCVALAAAHAAGRTGGAAQSSVPQKVSFSLIDSSIEGAADAAAASARVGVPNIQYKGDIGAPWLDYIEPAWRRAPLSVAGVTFAGSFFCLEQLARSYGLVCSFRSLLPMTGRAHAVSPIAAADRNIVLNEPGHGAGIGALFYSVLRLAAFSTQDVRKAIAANNNEAGDAPLLWLLQPHDGQRRADR